MDDVRYIKLHNSGGFVTRIHLMYKLPKDDGHGNISYPAEFSEWKNHGYADICASAERTVDLLKDVDLSNGTVPDGTIVKLKATIPLGSAREASEQYAFYSSSGKTASYNISGTSLNAHLKLKSYG